MALRRLFADSGLADRLQLEGADGMARAGNFNKACVIVEGLERDGCGIADVSRRYSDYIALAKEAPGALTCLDADFVRIMTVHTSKGLEFPHVAVAELKDGYPGGSAPSFFVENIGEATYVAAAWMPHGSWDKTAAKLRSWARALDERGSRGADGRAGRGRARFLHAAGGAVWRGTGNLFRRPGARGGAAPHVRCPHAREPLVAAGYEGEREDPRTATGTPG